MGEGKAGKQGDADRHLPRTLSPVEAERAENASIHQHQHRGFLGVAYHVLERALVGVRRFEAAGEAGDGFEEAQKLLLTA